METKTGVESAPQENNEKTDKPVDINSFTFSKSSMNALLDCPKQFEFQYVKKKKGGSVHPSAVKGIKIHSILEKVNKNEVCLTEISKSFKIHIDNYVRFLKENKLKLPMYSEKEWKMDFEGIHFKGIIDAIFVDGGRAIVLDYKTGMQHSTLNDTRFELQLYSLLAEKNTGLDVMRYGILYTGSGLFLHEGNDKKYLSVMEQIRKVRQLLDEKNFKAKYQHYTCNLCSFKDFCTEYGRIIGVKVKDEDTIDGNKENQ